MEERDPWKEAKMEIERRETGNKMRKSKSALDTLCCFQECLRNKGFVLGWACAYSWWDTQILVSKSTAAPDLERLGVLVLQR